VSTSAAALALVPTGAPRGFSNRPSRLRRALALLMIHSGTPRPQFAAALVCSTTGRGQPDLFTGECPSVCQHSNFDNGNLANPAGGTPAANALIANINAIDPNLDISYSMNYSLGIQRELPHGFFVEATYVGNQGRHLIRQPISINLPLRR